MTPRTLVTAEGLLAALGRADAPVLLDCGFDLADADAGERAWRAGHLPGAQYVHLDRDLCGPTTGRNGRHPLPAREAFAARVGRWGIAPGTAVVAYDAQGGPYAARAWWMLRWLGHEDVAVLDGGPAAFVAAGGRLVDAPPQVVPRPPYPAGPATMPTIDAAALLDALDRMTVLDARAGERFRGEVEPIDPVAGHIPGALHRCFKDNLDPAGRFRPAALLRAEFDALEVAPTEVVHHCGSGVTACHNLLAMELAGRAGSSLYPGSWSEWCADPARPVARG
jgi:thiosulfate/3-mercaptopyruvate sulfurtransferase